MLPFIIPVTGFSTWTDFNGKIDGSRGIILKTHMHAGAIIMTNYTPWIRPVLPLSPKVLHEKIPYALIIISSCQKVLYAYCHNFSEAILYREKGTSF